MENGAKVVSSAILGYDVQTIMINGKVYMIKPPTIHKIVGASYYLSDIGEANTIKEVMESLGNGDKAAHALSWFIDDSDDLYEEFANATLDEVMDGLEKALSLVSARNFLRLSVFAKNVQMLIANPKP